MDVIYLFFLLTAYSIVTALPNPVCPSPDNMDAEVLIFGAGITGLTVARQLYDNGVTDIRVLEARSDGYGGRMRSARFADATIELGANYIQQVSESESLRNRQPLWKLAKDTPGCANLTGHFAKSEEVWSRDRLGKYGVVNSEVVETLLRDFFSATTRIENLSKSRQRMGEEDISVEKAFETVGYIPETPLEKVIKLFNFDIAAGSPASENSLFLSTHELEHEGLNYFISDQKGFATVLECIIKGIDLKIELGTLVNSIDWNDDCVCASVTSSDGVRGKVCGKYGIVTFSMGVLKDWVKPNVDKFNPPFSLSKQKAIEAHGFGYFLKIFLQFDETFWNQTDVIIRSDTISGYFPIFFPIGQLLPGSPNVLIAGVAGSEAYRLSFQDPKDTVEEVMVVLRKLYGNGIPDPIDILIPTWISDPLYRGTYSYSAIGLTEADFEILKEPEGNLYLTGEAMSLKHFSYAHGGYCEGLATGNRILEKRLGITPIINLPSCSNI